MRIRTVLWVFGLSQDTSDLATGIARGWLPAFAIVKPDGVVDGHPASSKLDLFEGFSKKIVDSIKAQPELWKDTVVFSAHEAQPGQLPNPVATEENPWVPRNGAAIDDLFDLFTLGHRGAAEVAHCDAPAD